MPTLTLDDVLTAARDRHVTFDAQSHPDGPAARFIDGYQRRLLSHAIERQPDAVVMEEELAMPSSGAFEEGTPLPETLYVAGVSARVPVAGSDPSLLVGDVPGLRMQYPPYDVHKLASAGVSPVRLVPYEQRHALETPNLSAWIRGGVLYLRPPAHHWNRVTGLVLAHVPVPEVVEDADAQLQLPPSAFETLAANLAYFFAQRGTAPVDVGGFGREAARAEAAWLDGLSAQRKATTMRMLKVR